MFFVGYRCWEISDLISDKTKNKKKNEYRNCSETVPNVSEHPLYFWNLCICSGNLCQTLDTHTLHMLHDSSQRERISLFFKHNLYIVTKIKQK